MYTDEWFEIKLGQKILFKFEEFQRKNSSWKLKDIINLNANFNKHTPLFQLLAGQLIYDYQNL